ncbi:MAG: hypothetical protein WAO23_02100 [Dethiobacteria bacterium]
MNNNERNAQNFENKMHRLGRISGVMALIIILLVPTLICLKYRIFPPMQNIISGLVNITVIFLPIAVGEVLAFTPMLGSGASYLSFVSGNIGNLKIPCAVMSMDIAGVSPTTKEGDIISTISVAVSTMVTTLILIVGMLAIVPLTPLLSAPALAPAFEHILPALFGGLGIYWIMKQWKLALTPLLIAVAITPFTSLSVGALAPILAIISIIAARIMYKKGWVTHTL